MYSVQAFTLQNTEEDHKQNETKVSMEFILKLNCITNTDGSVSYIE